MTQPLSGETLMTFQSFGLSACNVVQLNAFQDHSRNDPSSEPRQAPERVKKNRLCTGTDSALICAREAHR
jgi:hypothetical protein